MGVFNMTFFLFFLNCCLEENVNDQEWSHFYASCFCIYMFSIFSKFSNFAYLMKVSYPRKQILEGQSWPLPLVRIQG